MSKKLIDVNKLWLAIRDDPNITGKQYIAVKEHILGAKTVDAVEVVHGWWVDSKNSTVLLDSDGCPVRSCLCSVCGEWLTASDEYACIGKYCPNCGAKMDGENK